MKKRCFPGAIILLVGVLASCGGGDKQQAASPSSAALQSADTSVPRVPALEEQFASIDADGGYPLTFRYWNNEAGGFIGDDPTLCAHYQGINRVQGYDGTSYLYLTRNGNPIFICSWTYDDYPGEILIVEMGDRTSTGEVFSEDFTGEPLGYGLAQPLAEDHTVRSIHLNGIDLGSGVDWKHPGSGQQVGDYLFIPVEKTCNYDADEEKCGGDEDPRGAILVLQVSDPMDPGLTPADPERLCQLEYFQYEGRDDAYKTLPMIGTLAATKKDGKYLFAHTTGGGYHKETALTFYEIEDENLCSRQNFTSPFIKRVDIWNADELKDNVGEDKWHGVENSSYFLDWQMINFLQDQGDSLFLLGIDKSGDGAAISSDDYARLFKVERSGNQFSVRYVAEKHFELKKAFWMGQEWDVQIGNFDAVGGVYVSPAGRLIMYSGTHDNDWPPFIFGTLPDNLGVCDGDSRCDGYPMGEFAANHFHPPELTVPDEAEADEGTPTFFDGCSFTDALTAGQSWEATVTWGDGSTDTIQATPDAPMPLEHGYEEGPSVHTVTVTVADSDGFTGTGSFDVTVSNVPPTVVIEAVTDEGGGILGVDIPFTLPGRELTLSGSYTDPGATDTHTGTVIWGDGTMTDLGAVSGPIHVPYTYNLPGFYTITFTVTDDDGGSGEASEAVTVLSVVDGLREIVEMLRPHAGNYRVRRAIADLEGNKGGQASNGAIDLLEKGNTNAALVHIGHAIRELTDAQAHDPGLDLEAPLYLLNMTIEELAGG